MHSKATVFITGSINDVMSSFSTLPISSDDVLSDGADISSTIIWLVIVFTILHFVEHEHPRRCVLVNPTGLTARKTRANSSR